MTSFDDDRRQDLELRRLDVDLDTQRLRLEDLTAADPVGVVWFGDNDDWLEKRLSDTPESS